VCCLLPGYGGGGLSGTTQSELVDVVLIILRGEWLVVLDTGESDRVSKDPKTAEYETSESAGNRNSYLPADYDYNTRYTKSKCITKVNVQG